MDLKFLLLAVVLFVCVNSAPLVSEEDRTFIIDVLEKVPESERQAFVIHQLYKGYVLNHPNDLVVPVPEETTRKMYDLFLKNFMISPVDPVAFSQLCFPSGECVDTDDPGVYP